MDKASKPFWFPAKRYGWGWGFPVTWQGWMVLLTWVVLVLASAAWFIDGGDIVIFVLTQVTLAVAIFIICLLKGEKPGWRWGDKS